jgi:hypothetical protein
VSEEGNDRQPGLDPHPQLYDRRSDEASLDEVERILI